MPLAYSMEENAWTESVTLLCRPHTSAEEWKGFVPMYPRPPGLSLPVWEVALGPGASGRLAKAASHFYQTSIQSHRMKSLLKYVHMIPEDKRYRAKGLKTSYWGNTAVLLRQLGIRATSLKR